MDDKTKRAIRQLNALEGHGKLIRLAAEWRAPWQSLISTILSARTRDDKTIEVSNKLYKRYDSINKLARARYVDVAKVIRGVNYYKTKTKHIISCAKMIVKNYKGKIPHDFAKLVELPGVGRKTANVFLAEKGHAAIGVDTHLLYCAQRLGWSKNKSPNKVEEDLKKIFPKSYWGRINYIVVRFGQSYRSKREKNALLDKIKKI